jgi:hypothetical protein
MSHRLQVLIPEELEGRLRKAAGRLRLSKGEWVRSAIEEKLGREASVSRNPLAALSSLNAPTADIEVMLSEIEAGRR